MLRRRQRRQRQHDRVAGDDQSRQRPALEDAQHAQHQRRADRERRRSAAATARRPSRAPSPRRSRRRPRPRRRPRRQWRSAPARRWWSRRPARRQRPAAPGGCPCGRRRAAIASPSGNSPTCRPTMNSRRPAATNRTPISTRSSSGNGWRRTTSWKNATTETSGARSRSGAAIRRRSRRSAVGHRCGHREDPGGCTGAVVPRRQREPTAPDCRPFLRRLPERPYARPHAAGAHLCGPSQPAAAHA